MFKIIICLSLLSCTVNATSKNVDLLKKQEDRNSMKDLIRKSVLINWVCGMENMGRMGSGVVVGREGNKTLVATAAHVTDAILERGCDISVSDWQGKSGYASVKSANSDTDVSVVLVDETVGVVAGLVDEPYLGQPVACVGWPVLPHKDYFGMSITRGYVSTLVDDYLRVSADLYFGNSGGACYSAEGEVVGIVSHFIAGGFFLGQTIPFPGQYFIANVDSLKKLLD